MKKALLYIFLASALILPGTLLAAGPVSFLTTEPASGDALDIAMAHVNDHHVRAKMAGADLEGIQVTSSHVSRHNGTTHVYMLQTLRGLDVVNTDLNISVDREGRVITMNSAFVSSLETKASARAPRLEAQGAVRRAAAHLGLPAVKSMQVLERLAGPEQGVVLDGADLSLDDIPVRLVYHLSEAGAVRLAWDLVLRLGDDHHWWNIFVDALSGDVIEKINWIADADYQVFALPKESPNDGGRTVEVDPADATASPFGWHDTNGSAGAEFTDTRGNNVQAQEDTDANNSGGFRPSGGAGLSFQFPLDLNQEPSTYQSAVIANLFYWNNVLHDIHYQYGFDEASGNFQSNNYGRGGSGQDPVLADAQDGSGTNNATFGTPRDGFAPRMTMFLWTPPNANVVSISAPAGIAGDYSASAADFGPALTTTGVSGDFKLADDGTGTVTDGCEAFAGGFFTGQIALIDRGSCSFVTKVRNAQNAGAIAAIIANNTAGGPSPLGDDDTGGDITIPSGMISQADGDTFKGALPGVTGTFKADTNPPPNRDSDLDNGIIAHEYGHGVSNRLTGGRRNTGCLNGSQSGGMGEGWSDFWALALTATASDQGADPRGVGTYVSYEGANGLGIRRFPYSTDMSVSPLTFIDLATTTQVHGVGETWNNALWDVYWNLVDAHGFEQDFYNASSSAGNILALQLVSDGLKLQGCRPTILDARDAILLADQNNNGGANECLIWAGFAKRGMGVNASDGGNHNSTSIVEDFSVPASCNTSQVCGNDVIEGTEVCDGTDLGGATCGAQGCTGGTLACNGTCDGYDTSACTGCPFCGNNVLEGTEECDGTDLGGATCGDFGCSTGFLACNGNCTLDSSSCSDCCTPTANKEKGPRCSNGLDDDCDGLIDGADPDC